MIKKIIFLSLISSYAWGQITFGPSQSSVSLNQQQAQGIDDIALVINHEALSRRQLMAELAAVEKSLPKNVPLDAQSKQRMMLESVISNHLLSQLAKKSNIQISDKDVEQNIAQIARSNGLSVGQLKARVARETGMNEAAYKNAVRAEMMQSKLQEVAVGGSINISPEQINDQIAQIARQQGSTIHIQDLLLPLPNVPPEKRGKVINETLAQISQSLRRHHNDLQAASAEIPSSSFRDLGKVNISQIPLKFARAVANLDGGQMVDSPIVDNDGMHFLKVVSKTAEGGQFVVLNARMAHILIRHNPKDPSYAQRSIQSIYAAAKSGTDFNALAKRYSQDVASAIVGGELGWMSADSVDPRFAQAMQNATVGQITAPFESSFGWHILKVYEKQNVDKSDEMLRARIRENLYRAAVQDAWERYLIESRNNAYIEIR